MALLGPGVAIHECRDRPFVQTAHGLFDQLIQLGLDKLGRGDLEDVAIQVPAPLTEQTLEMQCTAQECNL